MSVVWGIVFDEWTRDIRDVFLDQNFLFMIIFSCVLV